MIAAAYLILVTHSGIVSVPQHALVDCIVAANSINTTRRASAFCVPFGSSKE